MTAILQRTLSPIITSYLHEYVADMDTSDLKMSLWDGDVELENIRLRCENLPLPPDLPFALHSVHIKQLRLHIPWSALTTESVRIVIGSPTVVLVHKGAQDADTDDSNSPASTPASHNNVYASPQVTPPSTPSTPSASDIPSQGYLRSLVTKLLVNIVWAVSDLNVTYRHSLHPEFGQICADMHMDHLSGRATHPDWNPAFVEPQGQGQTVHKAVQLRGLSLSLYSSKQQASNARTNLLDDLSLQLRLRFHLLPQLASRSRRHRQRIDFRFDFFRIHLSTHHLRLILALLPDLVPRKSETASSQALSSVATLKSNLNHLSSHGSLEQGNSDAPTESGELIVPPLEPSDTSNSAEEREDIDKQQGSWVGWAMEFFTEEEEESGVVDTEANQRDEAQSPSVDDGAAAQPVTPRSGPSTPRSTQATSLPYVQTEVQSALNYGLSTVFGFQASEMERDLGSDSDSNDSDGDSEAGDASAPHLMNLSVMVTELQLELLETVVVTATQGNLSVSLREQPQIRLSLGSMEVQALSMPLLKIMPQPRTRFSTAHDRDTAFLAFTLFDPVSSNKAIRSLASQWALPADDDDARTMSTDDSVSTTHSSESTSSRHPRTYASITLNITPTPLLSSDLMDLAQVFDPNLINVSLEVTSLHSVLHPEQMHALLDLLDLLDPGKAHDAQHSNLDTQDWYDHAHADPTRLLEDICAHFVQRSRVGLHQVAIRVSDVALALPLHIESPQAFVLTCNAVSLMLNDLESVAGVFEPIHAHLANAAVAYDEQGREGNDDQQGDKRPPFVTMPSHLQYLVYEQLDVVVEQLVLSCVADYNAIIGVQMKRMRRQSLVGESSSAFASSASSASSVTTTTTTTSSSSSSSSSLAHAQADRHAHIAPACIILMPIDINGCVQVSRLPLSFHASTPRLRMQMASPGAHVRLTPEHLLHAFNLLSLFLDTPMPEVSMRHKLTTAAAVFQVDTGRVAVEVAEFAASMQLHTLCTSLDVSLASASYRDSCTACAAGRSVSLLSAQLDGHQDDQRPMLLLAAHWPTHMDIHTHTHRPPFLFLRSVPWVATMDPVVLDTLRNITVGSAPSSRSSQPGQRHTTLHTPVERQVWHMHRAILDVHINACALVLPMRHTHSRPSAATVIAACDESSAEPPAHLASACVPVLMVALPATTLASTPQWFSRDEPPSSWLPWTMTIEGLAMSTALMHPGMQGDAEEPALLHRQPLLQRCTFDLLLTDTAGGASRDQLSLYLSSELPEIQLRCTAAQLRLLSPIFGLLHHVQAEQQKLSALDSEDEAAVESEEDDVRHNDDDVPHPSLSFSFCVELAMPALRVHMDLCDGSVLEVRLGRTAFFWYTNQLQTFQTNVSLAQMDARLDSGVVLQCPALDTIPLTAPTPLTANVLAEEEDTTPFLEFKWFHEAEQNDMTVSLQAFDAVLWMPMLAAVQVSLEPVSGQGATSVRPTQSSAEATPLALPQVFPRIHVQCECVRVFLPTQFPQAHCPFAMLALNSMNLKSTANLIQAQLNQLVLITDDLMVKGTPSMSYLDSRGRHTMLKPLSVQVQVALRPQLLSLDVRFTEARMYCSSAQVGLMQQLAATVPSPSTMHAGSEAPAAPPRATVPIRLQMHAPALFLELRMSPNPTPFAIVSVHDVAAHLDLQRMSSSLAASLHHMLAHYVDANDDKQLVRVLQSHDITVSWEMPAALHVAVRPIKLDIFPEVLVAAALFVDACNRAALAMQLVRSASSASMVSLADEGVDVSINNNGISESEDAKPPLEHQQLDVDLSLREIVLQMHTSVQSRVEQDGEEENGDAHRGESNPTCEMALCDASIQMALLGGGRSRLHGSILNVTVHVDRKHRLLQPATVEVDVEHVVQRSGSATLHVDVRVPSLRLTMAHRHLSSAIALSNVFVPAIQHAMDVHEHAPATATLDDSTAMPVDRSQDDLRTQDFSFTSAPADGGIEAEALPVPLQLMLSGEEASSAWMAWAYPEARSVCELVTTPLTLHQHEQVSCVLSYWSPVTGAYVAAARVRVSQRSIRTIALRGLPLSTQWRLHVDVQDTALQGSTLAASVRISSLSPRSLSAQVYVSATVNTMQLSVRNPMEDKLEQELMLLHAHSVVTRLDVSPHGTLLVDANVHVHAVLNNMATNTQEPLLDACHLSAALSVDKHMDSHGRTERESTRLAVRSSGLQVCVGLNALRMLLQSARAFQRRLEPLFAQHARVLAQRSYSEDELWYDASGDGAVTSDEDNDDAQWAGTREHGSYAVFVLVNHTGIDLRYGQLGTAEIGYLEAGRSCDYHWYTHQETQFCKKQLRVAAEAVKLRWTDPVDIHRPGVRELRVIYMGAEVSMWLHVYAQDFQLRVELYPTHTLVNTLPDSVQMQIDCADGDGGGGGSDDRVWELPGTDVSARVSSPTCAYVMMRKEESRVRVRVCADAQSDRTTAWSQWVDIHPTDVSSSTLVDMDMQDGSTRYACWLQVVRRRAADGGLLCVALHPVFAVRNRTTIPFSYQLWSTTTSALMEEQVPVGERVILDGPAMDPTNGQLLSFRFHSVHRDRRALSRSYPSLPLTQDFIDSVKQPLEALPDRSARVHSSSLSSSSSSLSANGPRQGEEEEDTRTMYLVDELPAVPVRTPSALKTARLPAVSLYRPESQARAVGVRYALDMDNPLRKGTTSAYAVARPVASMVPTVDVCVYNQLEVHNYTQLRLLFRVARSDKPAEVGPSDLVLYPSHDVADAYTRFQVAVLLEGNDTESVPSTTCWSVPLPLFRDQTRDFAYMFAVKKESANAQPIVLNAHVQVRGFGVRVLLRPQMVVFNQLDRAVVLSGGNEAPVCTVDSQNRMQLVVWPKLWLEGTKTDQKRTTREEEMNNNNKKKNKYNNEKEDQDGPSGSTEVEEGVEIGQDLLHVTFALQMDGYARSEMIEVPCEQDYVRDVCLLADDLSHMRVVRVQVTLHRRMNKLLLWQAHQAPFVLRNESTHADMLVWQQHCPEATLRLRPGQQSDFAFRSLDTKRASSREDEEEEEAEEGNTRVQQRMSLSSMLGIQVGVSDSDLATMNTPPRLCVQMVRAGEEASGTSEPLTLSALTCGHSQGNGVHALVEQHASHFVVTLDSRDQEHKGAGTHEEDASVMVEMLDSSNSVEVALDTLALCVLHEPMRGEEQWAEALRVEVGAVRVEVVQSEARAHTRAEQTMRVGVRLGSVQVDNYMPGAEFPVLLTSLPEGSTNDLGQFGQPPAVQVSVEVDEFGGGESRLHSLDVDAQPLRLFFEDGLVDGTMELVEGVLELVGDEALDEAGAGTSAVVRGWREAGAVMGDGEDGTTLYYVGYEVERNMEALMEAPVRVVQAVHAIRRCNISSVQLRAWLHVSSPVYLSVADSPLATSAVRVRQVQATPQQLAQLLVSTYVNDVIVGAPAVLGSLQLLGNPTALVRSITTGVQDLVRLPTQGWQQGPREFVAGIGSGLSSLLVSVSQGTLQSFSGLLASLGRNISLLGMDSEQGRRRSASLQGGLASGLAQGVQGVGEGLMQGLSGIVTQPMRSASRDGAAGLFRGLGKGLLGAVARPVGAVFEMASQTTYGFMNSVGLGHGVVQRRPRRAVAWRGAVPSHPAYEVMLELLWAREEVTDDAYVYHTEASVLSMDMDCVLLLTRRTLYIVRDGLSGVLHDCIPRASVVAFGDDRGVLADAGIEASPEEHPAVLLIFTQQAQGAAEEGSQEQDGTARGICWAFGFATEFQAAFVRLAMEQ